MTKIGRNQAEYRLIKKILNGDSESYREIVDRYSPMVFHIVRSFVEDEEKTVKLAQQIFITAFDKLNTFNKRSKFSSWLYTLALNQCKDHVKNIQRNSHRSSEFGD